MTRQEKTNLRDSKFSPWIREKLPAASQGYRAFDVDWILYNEETKKLIILEHKCRMAAPSPGQRKFLSMVQAIFKLGMAEAFPDWEFKGVHLLQFETEGFDVQSPFLSDDCAYLDGKKITEEELINLLSF